METFWTTAGCLSVAYGAEMARRRAAKRVTRERGCVGVTAAFLFAVALACFLNAAATPAHAGTLRIDDCDTVRFSTRDVAEPFRSEWEAAGAAAFGEPAPAEGYVVTIGLCTGRDELCPAFPGPCEPTLVEEAAYRKAGLVEWFDGTPLYVLDAGSYRRAEAVDAFRYKTFWVLDSTFRWEPSFEDCQPGNYWVACQDPDFMLIRAWVNNAEVLPEVLLGPERATLLYFTLRQFAIEDGDR